MKKDITELFCFVDDFCIALDEFLNKSSLANGKTKKPTRVPSLRASEIITIILLFHKSPCKNFKFFYLSYLQLYKDDFRLPSYNRFVELIPRVIWHLSYLLQWCFQQSKMTGISYIDSTALPVCHNKRTSKHKVFRGMAEIGRSSYGWFLGFKLHIVINEFGEIQSAKLTPGNTDDRGPVLKMVKNLSGLLFGDKGYISQELFEKLHQKGLKLVTSIKKYMKNKLMPMMEKILLKKRSIVETVFDTLKNKMQILHTRHRSPINAVIYILSTLVAYSMKTKKPKISNTIIM